MNIEIKAMELSAHDLIGKHPFRTIPKRYCQKPVRPGLNLSSFHIECLITMLRTKHIFDPPVENSYTVDAQEHTDTVIIVLMIDVSETIDARLAIVFQFVADTIDHARSSSSCCHL